MSNREIAIILLNMQLDMDYADAKPYGKEIVDETIGDVFTICYNDEPVDKTDAIVKTAQFMLEYANSLQSFND